MLNGFKIVDTDCHQIEPTRMWEEYIDPAFRARAPKPEDVNGRQALVVEGKSLTNEEGKYPMAPPEFLAAVAKGMERFGRARSAGFDARSRLQDMDEQGVDAQVIYPTSGGQLLGKPFRDPELLLACCRAYNNWTAEYCSAAPERLRWAAMIPLQQVDLALEELARVTERGAVSFYIRPNPVAGRNLYHEDYEPLWAQIELIGKPVCFHDSGSPYLPSYGDRMDTHTSGHIIAHPVEAMVAMMSLIWFGVVERYPALRIVHVEADAGWLPYWLQRMEQHWDFSGNAEHPDLKMRPTSYFKRNFWVACRGDEMTIPSVVELVGDDNLLFNTDYPHPDGTWPWGMQSLRDQKISDESKRKILWDNPARAFSLDS